MAGDLFPEFLQNIKHHNMVRDTDKVLLAVSGGPDSMVLLHLFFRLHKNQIGVYHLNHGFRKSASYDGKLVQKFCDEHDIPVEICDYDVTEYIRTHKESKQQGARQIRYKLLVQYAKDNGYNKIALGHHADDQAETVLMRILRGSGLAGLGGIPPTRGIFIRPMLTIYKDDILKYCREYGVPYAEDETNLDSIYLRNKVRLELLPLLEQEYSPNMKKRLVSLAATCRSDEQELKRLTVELMQKNVQHKNGQVIFKRNIFAELTVAMQRRVLRALISEYQGDLRRIEFGHIETWRKELQTNTTFQLQLPQLTVSATANHIYVGSSTEAEWRDTILPLGGVIDLGNFQISTAVYERSELPEALANSEDFDFDSLQLPLIVRKRRPGDVMQPFGSTSHPKVNRLMIDAQLPRAQRASHPVIQDQKEIIWIPQVRRSEEGRVTSATKKVLRIGFHHHS